MAVARSHRRERDRRHGDGRPDAYGDQTHIRPRVVLAATSSSLLTPALLLRQGRRHATQPNAGFRSGRSGEVSLSTLNDRAETAAARPTRQRGLAESHQAPARSVLLLRLEGGRLVASLDITVETSRPAASSSIAGVAGHPGGGEAAERRARGRPSTARLHQEQ
jgi:hypothetical protein